MNIIELLFENKIALIARNQGAKILKALKIINYDIDSVLSAAYNERTIKELNEKHKLYQS